MKRLFIDLTKCTECAQCTLDCSYFYRAKMTDHGILSMRELGSFLVFCRRCENPGCVAACRFEALERQKDGVLRRYNLRCVSCKCCSHACPFGTILPDTLPFYVSRCDFCLERGSEPSCLIGCVNKAIEFKEVEESAKDGIYLIGEHVAVKSPKWDRKDV